MQHLSKDSKIPEHVSLRDITKFTVSAVILNDREEILLMLRDDCPVWVNIGGILDRGEGFEDALIREIREEANIEVEITGLGGDYYSPLKKEDGTIEYRHEKVFLCKMKAGHTPSLGNEGVKLEWFAKDALPKNMPPRYKTRVYEVAHDIRPKTMVLTSIGMKEFIQDFPTSEMYGLSYWCNHERVLSKKSKGLLRYWPESGGV
jgi:ADP-ribose pyrophosphatase YjhB (NUDIX family)